MPWSEILPQFSLTGTLLTVLLLFFAAVGEPLLGRRAFSWLSRREGDGRALELLYAVTMGVHILWGVLVLAVVLTSPDLHAVDLGLRFPDTWGPIVGGALGGLVALVVFWLLVNGMPTKDRYPVLGKLPELGKGKGEKGSDGDASQESRGRRGHRGHRGRRAPAKPMTLPDPGRRQYLLLPRTTKERVLAAGMAVTGGVFAELLYRGLFIVLVATMDVPLWIAAVLSVALFSLAHLYQGWWGLLSAGLSGTLFTILYLGTGSLVVPILVHVALNLRSIVFPPASELAKADEYADYEDDYYDDEYDDAYEEGYTGEFDAVEGAPEPRETTGVMPAQGPPPGAPGNPYGAPSYQEPRPQRHGSTQPPPPPQQPQPPQQPYRQAPPPNTPYGAPPPPPGHAPGDFLSHDPNPYPGTGRDQDGRRPHPDEWIDRRYRPGNDTPGSEPTGRG